MATISSEDRMIARRVADILRLKIGFSNAITNTGLRNIILAETGIEVDPIRMRKIIHHVRINNLCQGIVAGSTGYYTATSGNEMMEYIASLKGREESIRRVREKLERQYKTMFER